MSTPSTNKQCSNYRKAMGERELCLLDQKFRSKSDQKPIKSNQSQTKIRQDAQCKHSYRHTTQIYTPKIKQSAVSEGTKYPI